MRRSLGLRRCAHGKQGKFAEEARDIDPEYQPKTVCVDPWQATRQAWTTLFSNVSIILCFLHSILKIRKCSDVLKGLRCKLIGKGWHAYQARTKRQFSQRVRRLLEWSESHLPAGPLLDAARAISFKRDSFKAVYDFDNPHRTTNGVDRIHDHQDRVFYAMRYFHRKLSSASLAVRSIALLWNFHPYSPRVRRRTASPFNELNGFTYHSNWLRNLLIASSIGGRRRPRSDHEKSGERT